jgi:hypothetical protein
MKRLCFGAFAAVLNLCKPSKREPPQYKLLNTLFSSVCSSYVNAGISQSTSTQLIKCKERVSNDIVNAARDADPNAVAAYFSKNVVKCLNPNKEERIRLAILDIIANDDEIADDTVVDSVADLTKFALLSQREFQSSLAEFLAGVFLYSVIAVDNRVGQGFVKTITEEYINGLSNKVNVENADRRLDKNGDFDAVYGRKSYDTGTSRAKPRAGVESGFNSGNRHKFISGAATAAAATAILTIAIAIVISSFLTEGSTGGEAKEDTGEVIDTAVQPHDTEQEYTDDAVDGDANVKTLKDIQNEPIGEFNPADVMNSETVNKNRIYSIVEVKNALGAENITNWEAIDNIRIKYGDTEIQCSSIDEIFDFFEKQGILNYENTLLATRSIFYQSEAYLLNGGEYADKTREANEIEKHWDKNAPLREKIEKYIQKIGLREAALKFTDAQLSRPNSPPATVPALLMLLAKDYLELGMLYAKRANDGDRNLACQFYAQSVLCYAELYRMFMIEGEPEKVQSNDILYWIASLYHHLGDLTSTVSHYRIDEYGTATALQEEYGTGDAEKYSDYSRYFSAITSHKLIIEFEKNAYVPVELAEYFESAINNYLFVRDSDIKAAYKDDAVHALKWLKSQCESFVALYPEKQYLLQLFK